MDIWQKLPSPYNGLPKQSVLLRFSIGAGVLLFFLLIITLSAIAFLNSRVKFRFLSSNHSALSQQAHTLYTIRGKVLNGQDTNSGPGNILVTLKSTSQQKNTEKTTHTDQKGNFVFKNISNGKYRIAVNNSANSGSSEDQTYLDLDVTQDLTVSIEIDIAPTPTPVLLYEAVTPTPTIESQIPPATPIQSRPAQQQLTILTPQNNFKLSKYSTFPIHIKTQDSRKASITIELDDQIIKKCFQKSECSLWYNAGKIKSGNHIISAEQNNNSSQVASIQFTK